MEDLEAAIRRQTWAHKLLFKQISLRYLTNRDSGSLRTTLHTEPYARSTGAAAIGWAAYRKRRLTNP